MKNSNSEIVISAYVIAKILEIDAIDPSKESAGVLLGYVDNATQKLIITDFDTGKQRQTSTFVVLDDEALVQIVEDLQRRDRKESIVGWVHTHPSYGCFLSGTDKGTQRTYQNLFSKAVALVIDPSKYYHSKKSSDLEIQFFRLIDDIDYKAIPYQLYFDEHTKHISNLAKVDLKWELPKLKKEDVLLLHKKLESIVTPSFLEQDKMLLHGLVDILSDSQEVLSDDIKDKEILESIDKKLYSIKENINRIYNEETNNIYSIMNVVAVIILAISWFLIAYFV
ncbi:MAG: Mov34/MPN/PAD-1 family protein [Candidatus Heimdallarchaeota archaeon]|nr:Mov34/MPN/PAD-1 family protein [Candidatus Heimdallarchaeota archaeon]